MPPIVLLYVPNNYPLTNRRVVLINWLYSHVQHNNRPLWLFSSLRFFFFSISTCRCATLHFTTHHTTRGGYGGVPHTYALYLIRVQFMYNQVRPSSSQYGTIWRIVGCLLLLLLPANYDCVPMRNWYEENWILIVGNNFLNVSNLQSSALVMLAVVLFR